MYGRRIERCVIIFIMIIKTLLVIMYMLSFIGFHEDQTIIGRRIKFVFNHILQNRSQKWTISPKNTLFHPYPSKYPYFNISISIKKEEKTSSLKPTIKVHHRIPARLWSLVERALFVGILENLSHIHPLRGGNRYHL